MAVSKTVQRLLRVLDLEEEMHWRELVSAQSDLTRLGAELRAAVERERKGRLFISAGVRNEDVRDRLAGEAEVQAGRHLGAVLRQYMEESSLVVDELRAAFLKKRVERKQAETLVKTAEARESLEQERKTQQSLDSWYLMRPTANKPDLKRDEHEVYRKPALDDHT